MTHCSLEAACAIVWALVNIRSPKARRLLRPAFLQAAIKGWASVPDNDGSGLLLAAEGRATNILGQVPALQRLALLFAPQCTREHLTGLFALDARLASIVRNSREPMLAQLSLAWWREQLTNAQPSVPAGEPLLAVLRLWQDKGSALAGLASGWEAMTGATPLPPASMELLARARGEAFAALADTPADKAVALRMGINWALADIAAHLSIPAEHECAAALASQQDWRSERLGRGLRPLTVLHSMARRAVAKGIALEASPGSWLTAQRIGLFGR